MRGLKGKVHIVAGGGSGIGAATAQRLADEGSSVVIGDLDATHARAVADDITSRGGAAIGAAFDLRDERSIVRLITAATETFGGLDGLHINAADLEAVVSDTDVSDVPLEIFDRTLQVNLRGHFLCTRHALPALLHRGGGSIVYTSSGAAFMGEPLRVAYAISKNGLHALVRHVATRWGKQGIRANAVAPGLVMTDAVRRSMTAAQIEEVLAITRSQRLGEPADIAAAVAFLCSDDGAWINGQVLGVDGGVTMR